MSNISQARKVSSLKGHITRTINQIRDSIRRNESEEVMLNLRDSLYDKKDVYTEELYNLIEKLIADEEIVSADQKEKDLIEIDQKVEKVNEEIELFLKKDDQPEKNKSETASNISADCNLEKLTLPKFNGKDYFRWRSIFEVVVHSQTWTNKVKFLRLISCLESEPKELLRNYPPTDESYLTALDRLDFVYGGEQRRIFQAIEGIRNGRIIDGEDLSALRRFITALEGSVLNIKGSQDNDALLQIAKERLSCDLLRKYAQWTLTNKVRQSFQSLIDFLSEWIIVIESASEIKPKVKVRPLAMHAQIISDKSSGPNKDQFKRNCIWHQRQLNKIEKHYLDTCAEFKALNVTERRDFVFKNRLCRLCLKSNHVAKDCRNPRAQCKKCSNGNKHHFLLHMPNAVSEVTLHVNCEKESKDNVGLIKNNNCQIKHQITSLQTVPVKIRYNSKELCINAIIDVGSTNSFVTKEVIDILKIPTFDKEEIRMNTMNKCNELITVSKANLNIESVNGKWKRNETFLVYPKILIDSRPVQWNEVKLDWPHLKDVRFPELAKREHHEMLIGADLIHYHRCYKEIRGSFGSPIARLGPLGWTAFGPVRTKESSDDVCNHVEVQFCEIDNNLDKEVHNMWKLDVLGIEKSLKETHRLTNDECQAVKMFEEKLKFNGQRYVAPVLWSEGSPSLCNNYDAVKRRVQNMEDKLKQRSVVWTKVKDVIKDYENKGYIREVKENDVKRESFYLPYFPVIREDRETTKCRIVFDCSAKYNGQSLNDKILTGPKLQNDIIDVLIRFRRYMYAIIGDVSEMYLQIEIPDEDRSYCRFICDNKTFEWTRTIFGRADAPFIALKVIKDHAERFRKEGTEVVDSIQLSSYIDDYCESSPTESELLLLQRKVTDIFERAGMTIKKWKSNSKNVMSQVPKELRAGDVALISDDAMPVCTTKILGLVWNVEHDVLLYNVELKSNDIKTNYTKRQVLKIIARIYDPLCLLNPFINKAKVIFQKIWVSGVTWDENIPQELNLEFRTGD